MEGEIENIIKGCMDGDRASQYKLYNFLAPKLRVVCRRYMHSKEEAEDCLQEAFIKIFTNIQHYRGDGNLAAWARKVTVNTLITKLNKNKMLMYNVDIGDESAISVPSDIDPSSELKYEDLLNVLDLLSLNQKIVFNLYAIEGYDHKEIAEMLNITDSHSRNILSRARQSLLVMLQKTKEGHEKRLAQ